MPNAELIDARDQWVRPFYMGMLHGNCLRMEPIAQMDWRTRLREAASLIDPGTIDLLLTTGEWRGRLAASWFAGMRDDRNEVQRLGEILHASQLVYAGQGHCLGLAMMPNEQSEALLVEYLDTYLARSDLQYDQAWAVGALRLVSGLLGIVGSNTVALEPCPVTLPGRATRSQGGLVVLMVGFHRRLIP